MGNVYMYCPICGQSIENAKSASHLPHFYRCPSCGGYFHKEKSAPTYSEAYFADEHAPGILARTLGRILKIFLALRARILRQALPKPGGRVLDYGCGNGKLVAYLRKAGFSVEGFDPSVGAVALANKAGLPVFGEIPAGPYDVIMFWHSLEHTDTPLKDILMVKEHLAANGRLLIAVPNGDSMEAHLTRGRWFCYDWPFHRVHFNRKSLVAMLNNAGFRIISVDYINPEYTVSSLAQTVLNFFLPKNALYTVAANRRSEIGKVKAVFLGLLSLVILIALLPFLFLFFTAALITKRTAAMIIIAEGNWIEHKLPGFPGFTQII